MILESNFAENKKEKFVNWTTEKVLKSQYLFNEITKLSNSLNSLR